MNKKIIIPSDKYYVDPEDFISLKKSGVYQTIILEFATARLV